MDRRTFLKGVGSAAGVVLLPSFASRGPANRIDWYTSSDTNVLDFWSNFVKPKFEAAHPGITMNLVDGGDGGGLRGDRRACPRRRSRPRPIRMPTSSRNTIRACPRVRSRRACGPTSPRRGCRTMTGSTRSRGHAVQPADARLAGADRLRFDQAQARRRAQDLGGAGRLDQGQSRTVHLLPSRQGRLGQQLHPARRLPGERPRPDAFTLDNFSPEKAKAMLEPAWELLKDIDPYTFGQGSLHLGQHPVGPAPVAERRDHDHGLVGPRAVVDRAGRAAGNHRPGPAGRSGAVGRLCADGGLRQRRQSRGHDEALRFRAERRDPAAGRQRDERLPGDQVGIPAAGNAGEVRAGHRQVDAVLPRRRLDRRGHRRLVSQRRARRGPQRRDHRRARGGAHSAAARRGRARDRRSASCSSRRRCSSSSGW